MSTSPSSSSASELAAFRNIFVVNLAAMGWVSWLGADGAEWCWGWSDGVLSESGGNGAGWATWGRGNTISDDAYENTGVLAWQLRGPLFFHAWTVVDRKSRFRGPCEFTRGPWWTVVFKEI